jgi:two-component system CheB/CheR fusion protein
MESVPDALAERYFERAGSVWTFHPELRRAVIFGRHDLLQDAPISKVDLLLCRNTLMYFNAEHQARLVQGLHFSLAEHGHLLLGKVEMLLGRSDLFEPVDVKSRLFRKLAAPAQRGRLLTLDPAAAGPPVDGGSGRIIDAAFEHAPDPQLVLDDAGVLVAVNLQARTTFGIADDVVGRPFQDLEISYRPVELRSTIEQARADGRPLRLSGVSRWTPTGELTVLEVCVAPLTSDGQHLGTAIVFVDTTSHHHLQQELEQTHRELEVAYEELQSANEELETTNEELQSTIEELETTNEELQSTNEELETMNEELSSTNEELHAINDELRDRTTEVDRVNSYLESVLMGLNAGVVVVDPELLVRVWNGRSFDLWGLRPEEVEGRPFFGLDIGFPVEAIRGAIVSAMAGDGTEPIEVDAISRRGVATRCVARVNALLRSDGVVEGAIVIIEEAPVPG